MPRLKQDEEKDQKEHVSINLIARMRARRLNTNRRRTRRRHADTSCSSHNHQLRQLVRRLSSNRQACRGKLGSKSGTSRPSIGGTWDTEPWGPFRLQNACAYALEALQVSTMFKTLYRLAVCTRFQGGSGAGYCWRDLDFQKRR